MDYGIYGAKFEEFFKAHRLKRIQDLNRLPTPRLLAYFKKHRTIQHIGMCGCGCGESKTYLYDLNEDEKCLYHDAVKYVEQIKELLSGREHVETKK